MQLLLFASMFIVDWSTYILCGVFICDIGKGMMVKITRFNCQRNFSHNNEYILLNSENIGHKTKHEVYNLNLNG